MTVVDTTVEVPADRRVTLQLPSDLPTGRLRLVAIVAAQSSPDEGGSARIAICPI